MYISYEYLEIDRPTPWRNIYLTTLIKTSQVAVVYIVVWSVVVGIPALVYYYK